MSRGGKTARKGPGRGRPRTGTPSDGGRAAPRRTCVACREEADRDDLVRLVLSPEGALVVDFRARLPGRGAWVHPRRACVALLQERPGMLKRPLGAIPASGDLEAQLRARVFDAMLDGLSMASAAGALVGGRDVLERALREGQVTEVVVAEDAAERTIGALREAAGEAIPFTVVPIGRDELGRRVGRGARAALGITASRAVSHLRRQLRRWRALG